MPVRISLWLTYALESFCSSLNQPCTMCDYFRFAIMSWFGRAVFYVRHRMPIFVGVGLPVGIVVSLMPQSLLLQKYRKILAHTQNDKEKPIDSHTQSLIERVIVLKEYFDNYYSSSHYLYTIKLLILWYIAF